jgi:prolyl-tRNA synthetase
VYQFQTKFRNETRAKSGIMRGREFLMKDFYSFSRTEEEHAVFYEKAKAAYVSIFNKVGLGDRTYVTFALGGSFSAYSHEFQTLTEAGEDIIYVHKEKNVAINKEALNDETLALLGVRSEDLVEEKAVEVGNIFSLGTKFSVPLGLSCKNEAGEEIPVIMGSYGIGVGRLMGTVVESLSDAKGLVWPKAVAPFHIHLLAMPDASGEVMKAATRAYDELVAAGREVLFDDRDIGAGAKFADADLIGIPVRIVIGFKHLADGKAELSDRATWQTRLIPLSEISVIS